MIYGKFKNKCKPGIHVKNNDRDGIVLKISQDKEKALVQFKDGMKEWMEYWKLELT